VKAEPVKEEKPKAKKAESKAEKPKAEKKDDKKPGKGSEEMRERMARLRAMRKAKTDE
jgi:hypothetical protein